MSRDWSRAFRKASFKGASFWVDVEGVGGGRRVSIQHMAYSEVPVTEDFGARESIFPSEIYVASDAADREIMAVIRACGSIGPGRLVLPMHPAVTVHCTDFAMDRERRVNGYIPCSVEFVAAGSGIGFGGFNVSAALSGLQGLASSIRGAISGV